ncbi:putative inactive tRNA-specific adenosine like protein [Argiope bruennichi]|uniref:Putative inactive tRNA-specific adenosine like protein n=1 Tax=Argiope bruennichi TaxID=94029 RepID=A0A8T0EIE2_ARGBR|nr:putative inactive tRNA-specific adenosine like protein [Argiope bruennichi]
MADQTDQRKKIRLESQDSENIPRIFPVLGDEYFAPVVREKMFVCKINIKKETSRLIKELSSHWPVGNHLKRVRWTEQKDIFEILIRPVGEDEPYISVLYLLTHQQYKEAKEYWPVQFREDKNVENLLADRFFSTVEKRKISVYLKMALDVACYGDDKVGCVIVDPMTSETIAIAHDRRKSHPIQHAVMVAVDLVAQSQGGGSWNINSEHVSHKPFSKEEMEDKIAKIKESNPDKDAVKTALPYLCTGYDIYVSREPCVMCAMALVHSRIRRVFYAHRSPRGALESQCKLHLQDGLNHHYEVFRVQLAKYHKGLTGRFAKILYKKSLEGIIVCLKSQITGWVRPDKFRQSTALNARLFPQLRGSFKSFPISPTKQMTRYNEKKSLSSIEANFYPDPLQISLQWLLLIF